MAHHRAKVAVVVEAAAHGFSIAPGTDQHVDGFANGDAVSTQGPIIAGRGDRVRVADHRGDGEAVAGKPRHLELPVRSPDPAAPSHSIRSPTTISSGAEYRAQALDVGCLAAVEEVDPGRCCRQRSPGPSPFAAPGDVCRARGYFPKSQADLLLPSQPDHQTERLFHPSASSLRDRKPSALPPSRCRRCRYSCASADAPIMCMIALYDTHSPLALVRALEYSLGDRPLKRRRPGGGRRASEACS